MLPCKFVDQPEGGENRDEKISLVVPRVKFFSDTGWRFVVRSFDAAEFPTREQPLLRSLKN